MFPHCSATLMRRNVQSCTLPCLLGNHARSSTPADSHRRAKHSFPRPAPPPPTKHSESTMKHEEQGWLASLFFPQSPTTQKQGHVRVVHGDPFTRPMTQPQLRWGGCSSCERPHRNTLGVRLGRQVVPGLERRQESQVANICLSGKMAPADSWILCASFLHV